MKRPSIGSIATDAFFDNFTFAALFGRLRIPGSPREIVDSRPAKVFWADEGQQLISELRGEIGRVARILYPGDLGSWVSKVLSENLIKDEVLRSVQPKWPSLKPQENLHNPQ